MLSADLVPDIVVGRRLSAYFAGDVPASRQVQMTLAVYNERADVETGVLLTDTLAQGVTFVDASIAPDRDGQTLTWSLGTIPGYDHKEVTVTLLLPSTIPAQLDSGARVAATLNAGVVRDDAPPAALRDGSLSSPALLASTPDANITDPFVQEAAARLDYDPQRIFDFLNTSIGYNSYVGSLRGARGTLWSQAGNSLDVASLGVALMRASGIPAQYQQGNLPTNLTQQLILSMFPQSLRTVGYIPPGTATANPLNDFTLYTDSQKHTWFQFDTGDSQGMRDADPLIANATVGTKFTTATATFAEVPDNQRHKVELKLNVEMYLQAGALFGFGNGISTSTVMDQTFNAVDLVGRPITIGHFVSQSNVGFIITAMTNTYSPYMALGDYALHDNELPPAILGPAYQEVITNFPLGTQVVTAVSVDVVLSGPSFATQTYTQSIVDRIGYSARKGLASPAPLSFSPTDPPILTPFDLTTLNIAASFVPASVAVLAHSHAEESLARYNANPTQTGQIEFLASYARAILATFAVGSDRETANLAVAHGLAAYFDSPRITTFSTQLVNIDGEWKLIVRLNLLKDSIKTVLSPGQSLEAARAFNFARGLFDSILENIIVPLPAGTPSLGAMAIVQQSMQQGIPLVTITSANISVLQGLPLPADAIARISENVSKGFAVIVPTRPLDINGTPTTAWLNVDTDTGETIAQGQNGENSMLGNLVAIYLIASFLFPPLLLIPFFVSLAALALIAAAINDITSHASESKGFLYSIIGGIIALVSKLGGLWGVIAGSLIGWLLSRVLDPAVPPIRVSADVPFPDVVSETSGVSRDVDANLTGGTVSANVRNSTVVASGNLSASWNNDAVNSFAVSSLNAADATVVDDQGRTVGTGVASLSRAVPISGSVAGQNRYSVEGDGSLSFYVPNGGGLAVAGDWKSYSATVTGRPGLTLTVPDGALHIGNLSLPAGTYTIRAASMTLGGRGATSSPNYSGSVSIHATGAKVHVGPGAGNMSVSGQTLDTANAVVLAGYSGSLDVTARSDDTLGTVLNGSTLHVLTLTSNSLNVTADQNTPVAVQTNLRTSLTDKYSITADAPEGWTVSLDGNGRLTITPRPGLQSGTVPIRVVARSETNPELVTQLMINVAVTATQPGVSLAIDRDVAFYVLQDGAQIPLAYEATIKNLGPQADTFNISFPTAPPGFQVVSTKTSVTIPAGETAVVGVYLIPNGALAAPGTNLSFSMKATSTSAGSVTQTQTVSFTMPEVRGVRLRLDPVDEVASIPGAPVMASLVIESHANVSETVDLTAVLSTGLAVQGLQTVTLAPGEVRTLPVTFTPAADVRLNTTLAAEFTAVFGGNEPVHLRVPVRVAAPGADALASAAIAAGQLANPALANRFNDLSIALTNLVQTPSDPVFKSQAVANLDSLISQLTNDTFLSGFTGALVTARGSLASASTASDVQAAVTTLGTALDTLSRAITNVAQHGFTAQLTPDRQIIQPGAPLVFSVPITNNGSAATTYNLSVTGLPANVNAQFSQTSVTLQPGQSLVAGATAPTLTLTVTGDMLASMGFVVIVAAAGAPEITRNIPGQLTLRDEAILVSGVVATPPSAPAGTPVAVAAKIQGVVNQPTHITASFIVLDGSNNVLFTSPSTPVDLDVTSGLVTVPLGSFDTTGLTNGIYTIKVLLSNGGTATSPLLVGQPVTASLTTTPSVIPVTSDTVTSTVTVSALGVFPDPLTLLGAATTPAPGTSVAIYQAGGQIYAYESGTGGIDAFKVTDSSNPQLLKVFGQSDLVNGNFGFNIVRVVGDKLVVATTTTLNANGFNILVYSLADPEDPSFISNTFIPRRFLSDMLLNSTATAAFVPTNGVFFFGNTISSGFGNFTSIDLSDPAHPVLGSSLINSLDGGPQRQFGGTLVNDQVAYSTGLAPGGGTVIGNHGNLMVIDISDLSAMSVIKELAIPGTVAISAVAVDGNRALVIGGAGPESNIIDFNVHGLFDHLTLTVLDITDPRNPVVIGQTLVTNHQFPANEAGGKIDVVTLGNGAFAVSGTGVNGLPALAVIDASDENNIVIGALQTPSFVHGITVSGDKLFATTASGLSIYQINQLISSPVTITVNLPAGTADSIVAGSFNITPTEINKSASGDTLVWRRSFAAGNTDYTFTWQTTLTGVDVGEVVPVATGAVVTFVDQGSPGSVTLPGTEVTGVSIITIGPSAQTQQPGASSVYNVRLTNPTDSEVTYSLSTSQSPFVGQINVPFSVKVPAHGAVDVPLTITSNTFSTLGDSTITVKADFTRFAPGSSTKLSQYHDSATTTLTIAGEPVPVAVEEARGVVVQLTPQEATVGQGTEARYVVRVTNTGSEDDFFGLVAAGLPSGATATFKDSFLRVPPGASNFREVILLVHNFNAVAGNYAITVTATASSDHTVMSQAAGTLHVVNQGVGVTLAPASGKPGDAFVLTVRNTGNQTDTFDLTLAGPGALVAKLATSQVTLAPGASRQVSITTGAVNFAIPGALNLAAMATSTSASTVRDMASGMLQISPSKGMTAALDHDTVTLNDPGTGSFPITIRNTGNVDDTYRAVIMGTTGPVTAYLVGLDGQPTQSIDEFRLTALGAGQLVLRIVAAAGGSGTATVQIRSLTDNSIIATVTATLVASTSSAPQVVSVERLGIHAHPTTLVVTFDRPLNRAAAENVKNYILTGPHGRIRIAQAVYDAATNTVTLRPARRLPLNTAFRLTIRGTGKSAVLGSTGQKLDGDANGTAGGDYKIKITRKLLVQPGKTLAGLPNSTQAAKLVRQSLTKRAKAMAAHAGSG